MKPDEQNDAIRARVDAEMPRPAGGFETAEAEEAWRDAQEKRFIDLCHAVATKSKHSPGKWKTRKGFDTDTLEVFVENLNIQKPFRPCSIAVVQSDSAAGKANARLIAAAPELLEALEEWVEREAIDCGKPTAHTYKARLAIAKARGMEGGAL